MNRTHNTYEFCPVLAAREEAKDRRSRTGCRRKEFHWKDKALEDRRLDGAKMKGVCAPEAQSQGKKIRSRALLS